jgi:hypothetical protein
MHHQSLLMVLLILLYISNLSPSMVLLFLPHNHMRMVDNGFPHRRMIGMEGQDRTVLVKAMLVVTTCIVAQGILLLVPTIIPRWDTLELPLTRTEKLLQLVIDTNGTMVSTVTEEATEAWLDPVAPIVGGPIVGGPIVGGEFYRSTRIHRFPLPAVSKRCDIAIRLEMVAAVTIDVDFAIGGGLRGRIGPEIDGKTVHPTSDASM